jgi:hypothetical protein
MRIATTPQAAATKRRGSARVTPDARASAERERDRDDRRANRRPEVAIATASAKSPTRGRKDSIHRESFFLAAAPSATPAPPP